MVRSWKDLISTLLPLEQKPTETQAGMIADSVPSIFARIIENGFAKSQHLHRICTNLPDFAAHFGKLARQQLAPKKCADA